MARKVGSACLALLFGLLVSISVAEEDRLVQIAIETLKKEIRLPKEGEVKFVEKKESPIPGFWTIKLAVLTPTREVPLVLYVDSQGEIVIVGSLIVKGENISRKEAGLPKARKIDLALFGVERAPVRGRAEARMTIVEFSNFQCPYCVKSWSKMKHLLEKYPQEVRYVFKHFPLQSRGIQFELSEMVAATQDVSQEAFWAVHDFFFSEEGQGYVKKERETVKKKIEEILKERGYDLKAFEAALQSGNGRRRVEEDLQVGNKIGITGTPTIIVNGDLVGSSLTDQMVEQYLKKE